MIIINEEQSRRLLDRAEVTQAVADAFVALASGEAQIFPVAHGQGWLDQSTFSMKAGEIRPLGAIGLKVGSYWPSNALKGLANHSSVVLLLDPETGHTQALVSISYLNGLRTAAADGLAVRTLARQDARTLGIIGAGHQAWFEALAVCAERHIETVRIWSRSSDSADRLARQLGDELGVSASSAPIEVVCGSDILVTATSSKMPVVQWEWVKPGCHISAMGADQPGKRELARPYPAGARLFADCPAQSIRIGEFQDLRAEPLSLGAVLAGAASGRLSDEITIFDSSGLSIQDLAVAKAVVRRYTEAQQLRSTDQPSVPLSATTVR
jgi:ornithine cyclodeaminase/alanine dehydrogenase-like protein (mu-crystallin family)